MKWMALTVTLAGLLLLAPESEARSRYARGRTLFHSRCGQCANSGWRWSPGLAAGRTKHKLNRMSRTWSARKICTWQRSMVKRTHRTRCRPGRMTRRDKLDILYYLSRRLKGKIRKPRLQKMRLKLAGKIKLSRRVPMLRQRAQKRLRWLKRRKKYRRAPTTLRRGRAPHKAPVKSRIPVKSRNLHKRGR